MDHNISKESPKDSLRKMLSEIDSVGQFGDSKLLLAVHLVFSLPMHLLPVDLRTAQLMFNDVTNVQQLNRNKLS